MSIGGKTSKIKFYSFLSRKLGSPVSNSYELLANQYLLSNEKANTASCLGQNFRY